MKQKISRVLRFLGKLLLAIVLCYCIKDLFGLFYLKMSHINKHERLWVEPSWLKSKYPVFISEDGQTARYSFSWSLVNNESNPFFISSAPGFFAYYDANAGYSFDVKEDSIKLHGCFEIRKSAKNDSMSFAASLGELSNLRHGAPLKLTEFEMKGRTFRNCVVCDTTNCEYESIYNDNLGSPIDKFVISKRYGLIYYRHKDGREYFRDITNKKKNDINDGIEDSTEPVEDTDSTFTTVGQPT